MEPFMHRLVDYLKGELPSDGMQEIRNEIGANDSLQEAYLREKQFNDFLRSRLQRQPVSAGLAQNIRRKITQDRLDDTKPPHLA